MINCTSTLITAGNYSYVCSGGFLNGIIWLMGIMIFLFTISLFFSLKS